MKLTRRVFLAGAGAVAAGRALGEGGPRMAADKDRAKTGIYVLAVRKGNALIIDSLASSLDIDEHLKRAEEKGWGVQNEC